MKEDPIKHDPNMMMWQYCMGLLHLVSHLPGEKEKQIELLNSLSKTRWETLKEIKMNPTYRIEFYTGEDGQINLKKLPV